MVVDTSAANKRRQNLKDYKDIWLFGYGSLIYKVDFPFLARERASISGWQRRFWQGSHDHRGTPDNPGRVATLIEAVGERCVGMAYRVSHDVFDHLDHREKNGYLRHEVDISFDDQQTHLGLIYIAEASNPAFLGAASDAEIAEQIASSEGPSGKNSEYVLQLATALRSLNAIDSHVFEIEKRLLNLSAS